RRRRAGQCHRRRRSRRRQRARTRARERARFLCFAAALAGWTVARMARLGSSQHALERHTALPGRDRSKWRNQRARTNRRASGGATESIFQPEWSPDGAQIALVSDRSGWWNLYSLDLATRAVRALAPMAAEFGLPQWLLGMLTYAFAGPERIVCTYSQGGLGRL